MEKTCSKCKEVKSLDKFAKSKARKDGYNGVCKSCKSEYNKEHYKNNEDYYKDKAKKTNEIRRREANHWKYQTLVHSGGCSWVENGVKCDVVNPIMLDFDHLDRATKIDTVSQMIVKGAPLDEIKAEAAKCRILCANHHRLHTAQQMGHWQFTNAANARVNARLVSSDGQVIELPNYVLTLMK